MTDPNLDPISRDEQLADMALGQVASHAGAFEQDESLLRAAAALELAWSASEDLAEPMPRELRERVLAALPDKDDAGVAAGGEAVAHAAPELKMTPAIGALGWLAAAAAIALAFVGWIRMPDERGPRQLTEWVATFAQEHRDQRAAEWGDWAFNEEAPEIAGVRGEVVWSEEAQEGYMRFVGLPENDPTEQQYQLWIIDRRGLADANGQSARISGGVFDASSGERLPDGSVVIPIDPALEVQDAAAFAVTIEQPGGVWASDMTRRVVIAALDAG